MSFPRYLEYKYSEIKHLGAIPVHWNYLRARAAGNFSASGIDKKLDSNEITVKMFNYLDVYNNKEKILNYNDNLMDTTTTREKILEHSVRNGDLLFTPSSETADDIGHAALVKITNETVVYSYHLLRFRPKNIFDSDFLKFYFNSIATRSYFESVCTGTTRMVLVREDFKNAWLTYPLIQEQKLIAVFLDQQTAKIDTLVAEQEKMIELLKEKRQAVISHTMSKGLDPKVKMKDSGVEWLGEIPEHWKIYRVKKLLSVLTDYTANGSFASLAENVTYQDSGYSRLVRLTDLRENLENDGLYVDESAHNFLKKSELRGGEVLIANVGAYAGFACLMPRIDMKATLGPNMYLMKFKESLLSNEFALLMLMSFHAQEQLKLSATSTAQPKLNKDDVKEIWLALPADLSEQDQILNYVNSQKHSFDSLIEQAKLGIQLLQERRSALISAAVTGQIDVRNYQSKEVS